MPVQTCQCRHARYRLVFVVQRYSSLPSVACSISSLPFQNMLQLMQGIRSRPPEHQLLDLFCHCVTVGSTLASAWYAMHGNFVGRVSCLNYRLPHFRLDRTLTENSGGAGPTCARADGRGTAVVGRQPGGGWQRGRWRQQAHSKPVLQGLFALMLYGVIGLCISRICNVGVWLFPLSFG